MSQVREPGGGTKALCLQLTGKSQSGGRRRRRLWLHAGNLRLPLSDFRRIQIAGE